MTKIERFKTAAKPSTRHAGQSADDMRTARVPRRSSAALSGQSASVPAIKEGAISRRPFVSEV
ncbi:MAG: hypothetical protein ABI999_12655 [Acidobacteriota bacterium]